jgi:hypothetical protein
MLISRCLNNWLTDGGEAVSLTGRPPLPPRMIPVTQSCLSLSKQQGLEIPELLRKFMNFNYFIWFRNANPEFPGSIPGATRFSE